MAWSGLIHPPQLQHSDTDAGTQRTATWLELFFDLALVLVVAELAGGLRDDLTPHGAMVFAGLFTSVWWAWSPKGSRRCCGLPARSRQSRSVTCARYGLGWDDLPQHQC